jgi:two-component system, NarL family, invasion response regulator UvrY
MKNVLIVDDHTIVRYGTMQIMKQLVPDVQVSGAADMDQMIKCLREHQFELLILDINIPGGDNLQMIDIVKLRQPDIKILVFSGYDEQLYALRYLQSGADGYLTKHSSENEFKKAVHVIMNNDKYISPAIKENLLKGIEDNKNPPGQNPFSSLSNREIDVMQSLVNGLSVAEISLKLNIQVSTVSTYKHRIFEKMEISNIVELVDKARFYNAGSSYSIGAAN